MTTIKRSNGPDLLSPLARGPLVAICLAVVAVLVSLGDRYGYHRDELYFVQASRHLAWGYPDQPPITPALAWLVSAIAPDSLTALRVLSALAAGGVVLLTGVLARELGGSRGAQLLAASCIAVSAVLLIAGHMFSTTAFDLLAWTAISWIAARLLRGGDVRWWLAMGVAVGLGLQNKTLVVALPVSLLAGVLISGPRVVLRSKWFPAGIAIAALLVAPNLAWQAANGWPQFSLSASIAAGGSGTSESRWLLLPYQLVLVSPVLAPVWIAGLVRLLRSPALLPFRAFGAAWVLLAVAFFAAGGKPYYLAGLFPVLLAAGAPAVVSWLGRFGMTVRVVIVSAAMVVSLAVNSVLMLPVVPVDELGGTPIVDINYDAGETVGWPEFTATVAGVVDALPMPERSGVVIVTGNYGEAGAIDRFGPAFGLPSAFSGHNAFHLWGPPPDDAGDVVVAVGISRDDLSRHFGSVEAAATIDNGVEVDNDEQGRTVWVCRDKFAAWSASWPEFRRLG